MMLAFLIVLIVRLTEVPSRAGGSHGPAKSHVLGTRPPSRPRPLLNLVSAY